MITLFLILIGIIILLCIWLNNVSARIGIAKLTSWILERLRIKGEGYDSLFILSVAILSYAIPDLIGGNGYLSAYIVGIMLGNSDFPFFAGSPKRFHITEISHEFR